MLMERNDMSGRLDQEQRPGSGVTNPFALLPGQNDLPVFAEPSLAFLRYTIAALLTGAIGFLIVILVFAPDQRARTVGPLLMVLVAAIAGFFLSQGRIRATLNVLAFGTWTVATGIAVFNGRVRTPIVIAYPVIIMMIGWLVSSRAALTAAGLTIAATLGFVLGESWGVLPKQLPTPPAMHGVVQVLIFAVSTMLIVFLVRSYQSRLADLGRVGSELAQRTAEMEASRADLYRAQAVAKIGSWVYDLATDTLQLSAETCRIFGLPEGTTGSRDTYLARTHAEDRALVSAAWQAALKGEAFDYEHRIVVRKAIRWVRQQTGPEFAPDGTPVRAVGVSQDITERKLAADSLRASEERYRVAFRTSPDAINITRVADGCYVDVNDGFERLTGWRRDEVIGKTSVELGIWVDAADRERMVETLKRQGFCENLQFPFYRKDRSQWVALMSAHPIAVDETECLLSVTRDITERIRIEDSLKQKERYQRALLDNFPFLVWLKDANNRFLAVNQPFADACNVASPNLLDGKTDFDVWPGDLAEAYQADDNAVLASGKPAQREEQIQTDGGRKWFETYKAPVLGDSGELLGTVGFARDITERKATDEEIKRLAFYDSLTHLPNRRLLHDRLKHALASSTRSGKPVAVLFIDLDNFKTLNDTLGHHVGDLLLRQVAERLTGCVREGDTVARLGGDEFVVVLEDLSNALYEAATHAESVGEKILTALNQPYDLAGHPCASTPSIGIALSADPETTIDELMKRADVAMYQAKDAGRNTLRFFDPEMQAAVAARIALEADLRQGLELAQLLLHYQVQVDGTGRVTGAEALVRWQHPQRGLVSPAEFIPLAEETGLILPLGDWVLATACHQLVAWARQPATAHLTLAVNVSARQFRRKDFVRQVRAILESSGANPHKLKLELTESLLLEDVEDIIAKMNVLKALGVSFSLDDFGTGYSSLSYLKRLPLDQLKIDQSFVRDILTDPNDAAIARTIVALAQSLGLSVIAEGVETEAQREFLASAGCHACQGYLFGRPLPTDAFGELIRRT
jgi:diguanylate cyclase (GGDEF)-like protein/PAS domain S-box-containing protein